VTNSLKNIFPKLNSSWQRLSGREQRLTLIVLVLVLSFFALAMVQGMFARLRTLDSTVGLLQDSIINYTWLISRKQEVETAYQKIARQHSSKWTEAEIHDRLRQEIYRLAQKVPPPLDEKGIPVSTTTKAGNLLEIPGLKEGTLHDPQQGYREYMLNFSIPEADFGHVIDFLERLQGSPQSLRIDSLELNRSPVSQTVAANITIARTVTADAGEELADDPAAALSAAEAQSLNPDDWGCEGGRIAMTSEFATNPDGAIRATAASSAMKLFLIRSLPTGSTYDLMLDITATGPGKLLIGDRKGEKIFTGAEELRADSKPYRYHIQFTVPDYAGGRMHVRTPFILLENSGDSVYISNMVLMKAAG
jgi:hypothetical protein